MILSDIGREIERDAGFEAVKMEMEHLSLIESYLVDFQFGRKNLVSSGTERQRRTRGEQV